MPRNATGTYTLPLPAVISGELIESAWANTTLDDVGQALTDSLDRQGRGGMIAPFTLADGNVTNPGLAFSNAPGTGMYRTGTEAGFSWNAALVFSYNANGITLASPGEVFVAVAPTTGNSLANKTYVDAGLALQANYLPLAGGAMTGVLEFDDVNEGVRFSNGSEIYDAATTMVFAADPPSVTMGWFFSGVAKMSLSAAGVLAVPDSITTGTLSAASTVSATNVVGTLIAGTNVTATAAVSAGTTITAASTVFSTAGWFANSAASTGWLNNATGVGIYSTASDRLEQYSGSIFLANNGYFTGSVVASYSDMRLKTKTMPIGAAMQRLARLDAFLYKHNDLAKSYGYVDDEEHMGLSAQQVKQEFPQAVTLAPFDNAEGSVSKSGENYLAIKYDKMVPAIIAALKELNARLETLELPPLVTDAE